MSRHLAAVLLAATLCLCRPASARQRVLTNQDDVQACQPLPGGRVLLGTAGGLLLASADGEPERLWTGLDGLPGTRVHALLQEGNTVWIGAEYGLARLDLVRLQLKLVAHSDSVRAITRHQGRLYLGSWGSGVLRLEGARRFTPERPAGARGTGARLVPVAMKGGPADGPAAHARQRITSLVSVGPTLFVGTAGAGLWELSKAGLRPTATQLPSPFVWSLAAAPVTRPLARPRSVYVGTLAGLARVQGAVVDLLSSADVRALLAERELLVGTYGAGLEQLSGGRMAPAKDWSALAVRFVNVIGRAHDATCVGTRAGAWLTARGSAPRRVRTAGPPSNDISALAADGDRLYVGTFDGGLALLERGVWRRIRSVDRRIDALTVQHQGDIRTLWVGTPRGLFRVRGTDVKRFGTADGLRHQHVHCVAVLRDGSLLAGTGLGAVIVRGEQVEQITVKQGLPVASVWAAAEDGEGGLWLGTTRGLYHWSRPLRRYTRYSVSSGHLKEDWVTAVTLHRGAVYVGSYNAGVSRLTRSADGTRVSAHLGGGWVNFNGLRVVGQTLYAASMSGLHQLPIDGGTSFVQVARAAPGRDVTAVEPSPAGLWVASRRGLALHGQAALNAR